MLSAKDLLTPYHHAAHEQVTLQAVVLMQANQKKRETADLAAGRLVRISFFDGTTTHTDVYPARVAAFICKVLGPAVGPSKGVRFTITSQGRMNQSHYAHKQAGLAVAALICRKRAEFKWYRRGMARWKARYAREAAQAALVTP
jgi:hypothetical protein